MFAWLDIARHMTLFAPTLATNGCLKSCPVSSDNFPLEWYGYISLSNAKYCVLRKTNLSYYYYCLYYLILIDIVGKKFCL